MSREDVQQAKESEGIVVGSILVKTDAPDDPAKIIKAVTPESENCKFIFSTKRKKQRQFFGYEYTVKVRPGEEEIFVTKLEAGEYHIIRMDLRLLKILKPNFFIVLNVCFTVEPGTITYIGRLVYNTGRWAHDRAPVRMEVEDAQVEAMREKYPDEVKEVNKNLMQIRPLEPD
jgi:hypothetical protein